MVVSSTSSISTTITSHHHALARDLTVGAAMHLTTDQVLITFDIIARWRNINRVIVLEHDNLSVPNADIICGRPSIAQRLRS